MVTKDLDWVARQEECLETWACLMLEVCLVEHLLRDRMGRTSKISRTTKEMECSGTREASVSSDIKHFIAYYYLLDY
jgi:hypothetical protein